MEKYDVIVLGAGPGGYESAIRCVQYGLRTALVEARELGGTCLNRGCIPTKALLQGAHIVGTVKNAAIYGMKAESFAFDYSTLTRFKNQVVDKLVKGIAGLEKAYGVDVYHGFGILENAHTIRVGEEVLTTENIILATGSKPVIPPIPGVEQSWVMDSDAVLSLETLPNSVVIIGGGVIGMEFATLFSELGAQVTVLEMMDRILPGTDPQIASQLERCLKRKKVKVMTGVQVQEIGDHIINYIHKEKELELESEACVFCTGRAPSTIGIGLEKVGICTERNFIEVNELMETNVRGIYAIGDITGKMQLAHVASKQGMVAAAMCAGKARKMRYDIIPACIYTSPEIAYVGLSEEAALENGYSVASGVFQVSANGKSAIMDVHIGMAKIVTDKTTGRILGAQLMAPNATEIISEVSVAIYANMTVEELSDIIHPHPTVNEMILQAALDAQGLCCNTMPKQQTKMK